MTKKYRDGLFRNYFSDKRRLLLLGLCNLLTSEDATDPDEITINTLDGVFFDELKNDISCLFRGRFLIIIEHQSTINENMPLRILFYVAELLRQYADQHKSKIYLEQLLHLPEPKFFVFYNGKKKECARRIMRLSDAFGKQTCLEVIVELYNLNKGMNDDFIASDVALNNYCTFVNLVEKFKSEGLDSNHALAAAFKYCVAHGFMAEYLLTHREELASMLAMEYDPEAARQAWIDYGIKQGIERGIERGREELARNLLNIKTPIKYIVEATGWTEDKIRNLANMNGGD